MTFETSDPIVSGGVYRVTDIDGGPPTELGQFVGNTMFTIADDHAAHLITGVGDQVGEQVRFYEKDTHRDLKDVRVWQIGGGADGAFVAQHVAAI